MGNEQGGGPEMMAQEQAQVVPQEMMAPVNDGGDNLLTPENLKYMLSSSDMLKDFEIRMRGLVWNEEKQSYVQKKKAIISDKGFEELMCRIEPYLSNEVKLTNIDSEMIPRIIKVISANLAVDIYLRNDEWGIDSLNCNFVYTSTMDLIYASYCRGSDAHEKRFLRSTQYGLFQMPQSYANAGGGRGGGSFLGKLNPFKKRSRY